MKKGTPETKQIHNTKKSKNTPTSNENMKTPIEHKKRNDNATQQTLQKNDKRTSNKNKKKREEKNEKTEKKRITLQRQRTEEEH